MASAITHGIFGLALGKAFTGERMPARFWLLAAGCAASPDLDAVGYRLGVPYDSLFGHRGLSHSLLFAMIVGAAVTSVAFRDRKPLSSAWFRLAAFFALATASHAMLDSLTDGGLGVALFSPLDETRYFFPFRPLRTSPMRAGLFLRHATEILTNEAFWVGIPAAMLVMTGVGVRRLRRNLPSFNRTSP